MQKQKYVLRKDDGFVSDYNASERSCDWVCNKKNADKFHSIIDAANAAVVLDLPGAVAEPA